MAQWQLIVADLAAVAILVFVLYFPRYRRRDMVVAILGVNVGVLAVASVLSSAEVSVGLGLGLFGVLAIIRIRSQELGQEEIVYYFAALVLGMLGGIDSTADSTSLALMVVLLAVLFLGDHPRLYPDNRHEIIKLDGAFTDEAALRAELESLLGGRVRRLRIRRLDLAQQTTTVDVRYQLP